MKRPLTPYQGFVLALAVSGLVWAGLTALAVHLFA